MSLHKQLGVVGAFLASIALAAGAVLTAQGTNAANVISFDVGLSGLNEVPVAMTAGKGVAHFTFDESTRELTYSLTVSGLSPNLITAAHIHRGAAGVNGPIVYPLSTTGFTQASGEITLTPADVADLKAGNFYVNVHSVEKPGGFARGQMYLDVNDAIGATARRAVALYNAHDPTFFEYFTDTGLRESFDASRAEVADPPEDVFEPPIEFHSLRVVGGDSAGVYADLTIFLGLVQNTLRHQWVLDGVWRINSESPVPGTIPQGTKAVDLKLQEYAFVYDKTAVTSGDFAFKMTNTGKQPHEAALLSLDTQAPLSQIVSDLAEAEEFPTGVEFLGVSFAGPGEESAMVFSKKLPAGRYALLCFIPDEATGAPHAFLGMQSEFTVGGGAAGGIRPPSTGDAGLLASRHGGLTTSGIAMLVCATLLALAGGVVAVRNR